MLNDLDSAERLVQHIEEENDVLDMDKIRNHITQQRQRSQTSYSVIQVCNPTAGTPCKIAVPPTKKTDSIKSSAYITRRRVLETLRTVETTSTLSMFGLHTNLASL